MIFSRVSATFPVLRKVFSLPFYSFLAGVFAFSFFLVVSWLPNFSFIVSQLASPKLFFSERVLFFFSSFLPFNFPIFGIAILFGVNVGLLGYLFSLRFRMFGHEGGVGILGVTLAVLGAGCASCGTALLSFLGVSGVLVFLPFGGALLLAVGAGLLAFSIYLSALQIGRSGVCSV